MTKAHRKDFSFDQICEIIDLLCERYQENPKLFSCAPTDAHDYRSNPQHNSFRFTSSKESKLITCYYGSGKDITIHIDGVSGHIPGNSNFGILNFNKNAKLRNIKKRFDDLCTKVAGVLSQEEVDEKLTRVITDAFPEITDKLLK
jgi:hypothetical protein